jgi:hypothetical protein
MLKKIVISTFFVSLLASCVVKTTGPNRRCPYPQTMHNGRCVNKQAPRRNNTTVIIRDHR